jgi:hypothetical protein
MKINLTAIIITALLCATVIALMFFFEAGTPREMPLTGTTTEPTPTDIDTLPPAPMPNEGVDDIGEPILESPTDDDAPMVACTMDAKQCPDGTYVGRVAPDCEFAACPTTDAEPVACTEDAKICPDGTVVVREAPSCEFAACPVVETEPVECTKDIQECPDGSFVSRVAPECEFAACPTPNPDAFMELQAN